MALKVSRYSLKQIQADTLTPISIFQAIEGKHKVLFESNAKHEESGRYSFIAFDPVASLEGDELISIYQKKGEGSQLTTEPVIDVLQKVMPKFQGDAPFSFFGGAIGHFGYETAYHFERIAAPHENKREIPDVHVLFYEKFIVIDHIYQTVSIVAIDLFDVHYTDKQLQQIVEQVEQQIMKKTIFTEAKSHELQFATTMEKAHFINMVEKAKEHIIKGDIFQVVLSQAFEADFNGYPFDLYRKLRTSNASPYMFYVDFGSYVVFGTSPESLVKVNGNVVTTNPIAGTKRRGNTKDEDEKIAKALLQDEKELAEHKMLVDLGRNDIGRVSKNGSVKVSKYMQIEKYKHVMHIVSEVNGVLKDDLNAIDVLKACLPAGTVSGAPKIRAMQIIHELENQRRNIYAGAIGYISATGDMDLALAIRTMIVKDGKAIVQAGAGVVYDSNAESEYEETWNKARALLEVQHDFINR